MRNPNSELEMVTEERDRLLERVAELENIIGIIGQWVKKAM